MSKLERLLSSSSAIIMGVLNVTPDSFSDGGEFVDIEKAISHSWQMINNGAKIIDIGGESSRPGSLPVSVQVEIDRVLPVVEKLLDESDVLISIDTYKPLVAEKCLEKGAHIINDITGLKNPDMRKIIAKYDADVVIMHMQKNPVNMQNNPVYENVIDDIINFFDIQIKLAEKDGISKIILDPGIGFGKTLEHNLIILNNLDKFKKFGYPIMIGTSRKSFIGEITNSDEKNRLSGTIVSNIISIMNGAKIVRVHDVGEINKALLVFDKIVNSKKYE